MNTDEILHMEIRPEAEDDISAIHAVNAAAFEREGEAGSVDALRRDGLVTLSLVARAGDEIVGHVLFCPVTVGGAHTVQSLGRWRWFRLDRSRVLERRSLTAHWKCYERPDTRV